MTIHNQFPRTQDALNEAQSFLNQTANPPSPQEVHHHTTTVHHHHYENDWGWTGGLWGRPWYATRSWDWYQPTYVTVNHNNCDRSDSSSKSKKSDKEKDYTWIAIPAALITLATTYFIGQSLANQQNAAKRMGHIEAVRKEVREELNKSPSLFTKMEDVFSKQLALLNRTYTDETNGTLLKGALAASAAIAGIGALITTAGIPLIAMGLVGGFVSTTGLVLRSGVHSSDDRRVDAAALNFAIHLAKDALNA